MLISLASSYIFCIENNGACRGSFRFCVHLWSLFGRSGQSCHWVQSVVLFKVLHNTWIVTEMQQSYRCNAIGSRPCNSACIPERLARTIIKTWQNILFSFYFSRWTQHTYCFRFVEDLQRCLYCLMEGRYLYDVYVL